jgi:cobalt/nickel transport system permease protein
LEVAIAHIPDGVLSAPVVVGDAVIAGTAVVYALRKMDYEAIPRVAVMTALFFVASLVSVPVGPSSAHLILAGLMGLVLGWATVPAVLIGLVLQAVLFGFGGLTTLGVNTVNIALPAVLWSILLRPPLRKGSSAARVALVAGAVSALSVASTGVLVAVSLILTDSAYVTSAQLILVTYLPLMAVEALVVAAAAGFLVRVKPDILGNDVIAVEVPADAVSHG